MRSNPLVTEVLAGIPRHGRAQLEIFLLLLLQAVAALLWWPRDSIAQVLEAQAAPDTLAIAVMAFGAASAWFAVRAGAEEIVFPGQRGLREWATSTGLRIGRVLRGYVLGQLLHSAHLLLLASPLLLVAFTISGGEWPALAIALAAALVQALFYRLAGAITHLTVGAHPGMSRACVRTLIVVLYLPVGLLVPELSHVALASSLLGDPEGMKTAGEAARAASPFLASCAGLSLAAAGILHFLLRRARRRSSDSGAGSGLVESAPS